jgi:DUF971 family protein
MNPEENSASPRPTGVKAPHGARDFVISWDSGEEHKIPHKILRGYCPCAGCQGHSGEIHYQENPGPELLEISTVGNYALGLKWVDGHETGIYTFRFLHELGRLYQKLGLEGFIALDVLPRAGIVPAGHD